jgi:hypothetical protein
MEAEGFFSLVNANKMTLSAPDGDILRIASSSYNGYVFSNYFGSFGFWDGNNVSWYITKTGIATLNSAIINGISKVYCGGLGTGGSYVNFRGINGNFPIIDSTDDLASHNTAGLGLAVLGTTVLTVRSYPYNYTQLDHASGTGNASYYNLFTYNGAEVGSVAQSGTTNVQFNTSSDKRLKNDCGLSTDTSVIDSIKIHNFTWKEDGKEDIGVFAQEAYEVKPTAVKVGNDDLTEDGRLKSAWGVDYSKFVPDLIVYCQQLKSTIKTMEERILALESKIN